MKTVEEKLRAKSYIDCKEGIPELTLSDALQICLKALEMQREEIKKLKELINTTYKLLADAPELNMSNYDENQVDELNQKMIEAYSYLNYNQPTFKDQP